MFLIYFILLSLLFMLCLNPGTFDIVINKSNAQQGDIIALAKIRSIKCLNNTKHIHTTLHKNNRQKMTMCVLAVGCLATAVVPLKAHCSSCAAPA